MFNMFVCMYKLSIPSRSHLNKNLCLSLNNKTNQIKKNEKKKALFGLNSFVLYREKDKRW